jgi:hypothetical protein
MKKTNEQIKDELVDDLADSASNDNGFLRSLVRTYVESFSENAQRQMWRSAFDRNDDIRISEELRGYCVLYRNNSLSLLEAPFGFLCQADSGDHAEEQCLNAEPDAEIVWVVETNDYQVALNDYWGNTNDIPEELT